MISGLGFSSFQAGAALVPIPLAMAILSPFMGALSDKIGARPLLIVGPMLIAVGCCLMLFVGEGSDYWRAILPSLGFFALGMVACAGPLTSAVLTAATAAHVGAGSAFNSTAARGGGLFATAAVGGVFSSSGPALIEAFHRAAMVGAVLAVAAAACLTLFAIEGPRKPSPQESAPS
ncbi:MAG: Drug resistance transporter EmrB/QacA subfamily [Hyphomicrobiales bacterium]|nr:Drug resistance transporter EmrB/QacA subfamily [Hyphomicrobiales bacterium]